MTGAGVTGPGGATTGTAARVPAAAEAAAGFARESSPCPIELR
jgi:nitrous oxide reductase